MGEKIISRTKKKLAKTVEPFPIKNDVMYRMRHDNTFK
jgi:hypothetical protein